MHVECVVFKLTLGREEKRRPWSDRPGAVEQHIEGDVSAHE
jgi:hypothetical protein